uniref:Lipopolysaccharide heptosyltransferase family protein n=1 Tax=candidate division WOR-3 bacterium TaxID=2052148 RepID=A0A7C4Y4Z2_UNCW3
MKIGVIRLSSLGDLVLLTPFLENLRNIYKDASIYLFTEEIYKELFTCDKRIDYVLSEPIEDDFDIIYDMHRTMKSKRFIKKMRFKKYITLNKRDFERRFMIITKIRINIPHAIYRYLEVLKNPTFTKPVVFIKEENIIKAKEDLKEFKRPFIGFLLGAKRRSRVWMFYDELSNLLDGNVFLFGSKEEDAFSHIKRIKGYFGLNLNLLGAYLSLMDLTIGNDSGTIHLAQAVGTKSLMIYGSSIPEFGFRPFNGDFISKNLPCKPCSLHGTDFCPFKFKCLSIINPSDVYKMIKRMI